MIYLCQGVGSALSHLRPLEAPLDFTPARVAPPKWWLFVGLFALVTTVTLPLYAPHHTVAGWLLGSWLSIIWSLPFGMSIMVLAGLCLTYGDLRRQYKYALPVPSVTRDTLLIVQLPTIGRHDVMPSLRRVVASCEQFLPKFFDNWRIDVIAEEKSEARDALLALGSSHTRVLFVDAAYETLGGTKRKARANVWADQLRAIEGETHDNVWVLHMDDDTGIGRDTAEQMAKFIRNNPAGLRTAKHLVQGILTYPRQFAVNKLTWLADAVRPASDLSLFRLLTGRGNPLVGAHGELLLVRSSIEHQIGWDFGRILSITEDANFALLFASKFPGKSAWFSARCYGASPATLKDLVTQRERWARGLIHVACNPALPFKQRALLGYALSSWVVGPFQHIFFVLIVASLTGDMNTSPVTPLAIIAWACNMAAGLWMYVEGLMANVRASGAKWPTAGEWFGLLLMPFYSFLEGWAGLLGGIAFAKDRIGVNNADLFPVIAKPYVEQPVSV